MTKQRTLFGTNFERERVRRGWTQQYIADQLGIGNANTVSRWVRGENLPRRSLHKDLSKLFGMSLEELGLQEAKSTRKVAHATSDELLTQTEDVQKIAPQTITPTDTLDEDEGLEYASDDVRHPDNDLPTLNEEDVDNFSAHRFFITALLSGMQEVVAHSVQHSDVAITVEPQLVTTILREVQNQRAALPLIQCTLAQLVVRRSDNKLTLKAYDEIGGISGALSLQAEETYHNLPTEEHRELARMLFLRLITLGTTEQDITRRRASLTEFTFNDVRQSQIMSEVIELFALAKLLVKDRQVTKPVDGPVSYDETNVVVELIHDALLSEWKRLADWIQDFRCDTHFQQHISKDAVVWKSRKQRDRLYRGVQLREAKAWAKRTIPNHQESDFLRAALAHQLQIRIVRVFMTCVVIVTLFPFVSSLFGYRTFLSSPILPGGWWISPQSGGTFDDFLHLAAYAYPSAPTEPAITYVDFTARWGNTTPWETLCHIDSHTSDNVFQCTVNLSDLKAIAGIVRISFNVYDEQGNVHDAPNGVHLITYVPAAKMRASPTKCPWETKTTQT